MVSASRSQNKRYSADKFSHSVRVLESTPRTDSGLITADLFSHSVHLFIDLFCFLILYEHSSGEEQHFFHAWHVILQEHLQREAMTSADMCFIQCSLTPQLSPVKVCFFYVRKMFRFFLWPEQPVIKHHET